MLTTWVLMITAWSGSHGFAIDNIQNLRSLEECNRVKQLIINKDGDKIFKPRTEYFCFEVINK